MRILPALLALLPLAVGGLAAFAWHEAGVDRYAGLEAEGRALAGVLRSNVLDASENVRRAERALEGRLRATAKWASDELEFRRAPRADVLSTVAMMSAICSQLWVCSWNRRRPVAVSV